MRIASKLKTLLLVWVLSSGWLPACGQTLLPYAKHGKWGYLDPEGNVVIRPRYMQARLFSEGLGWAQLSDTTWGILSPKGKILKSLRIDNPIEFRHGVAFASRNGLWGAVDTSGWQVIPFAYTAVRWLTPTLIVAEDGDSTQIFNLLVNNWLPYVFQSVQAPSNGYVGVNVRGGWGFLDAETGSVAIPFTFQNVFPFQEHLGWARSDGLWGIIDTLGRWVALPQFDRTTYGFVNGRADVRVGPFEGIINRAGEFVLPAEYQAVGFFNNGLAWFQENRKVGFVDTLGRMAIQPHYDDASGFSEGLARVARNGRNGFVDTWGNEVVGLLYQSASDFHAGLALVKLEGKWGAINPQGTPVLPFEYEGIERLANGLLRVRKLQRYGLYSASGAELLPPKYAVVEPAGEFVYVLEEDSETGYLELQSGKTRLLQPGYRLLAPLPGPTLAQHDGNSLAWLSASGQSLINFTPTGIAPASNDRIWLAQGGEPASDGLPSFNDFGPWLASQRPGNGSWGSFWVSGQQAVPFRFRDVLPLQGAEAVRFRLGDKWGLAQPDGAILVEPEFDFLGEYHEGYLIARKDSLLGIIDLRGRLIVPIQWNYLFSLGQKVFEMGVYKKDVYGGWHYFSAFQNSSGHVLTDKFLELASPFSEGHAGVMRNGKWAAWNVEGRLITDFQFEGLGAFKNGLAPAKQGGLWGFINQTGGWAIEARFAEALSFNMGLAAVKRQGKWGYINQEGMAVIPFIFEAAGDFRNGAAPVRLRGKWGLVNHEGILVLEPEYDAAEWYADGVYRVTLNQNRVSSQAPAGYLRPHYGLVRTSGQVLAPCVLEGLSAPVAGIATFLRTGGLPKMGYLRLDGTWVLRPD